MPRDALRLDVRTRRTLLPGWREEEASFVPCPLTGQSRAVETCQGCERNAGIVRDSAGHWFVVCCAQAPVPLPEIASRIGTSWENSTVAEAMCSKPSCIYAEVELREVVALLVEHGISGAPVVDQAGRPIGMISKTDLLLEDYERAEDQEQAIWTKEPTKKLARDIMTKGALTIGDRAPLVDAVRLMADQGVHRLAVVDADGLLVGVLSTLDILSALAARTGPASATHRG